MEKLINSQIETLQTEIEEISDPYQRAHIRVLLISALGNLSTIGEVSTVSTIVEGKEAIKNDIVKENNEPINFEEPKEEKAEEVVKESNGPEPIEIDEQGQESSEPIIIETEEGQLDITEAYNALASVEDESARTELAMNITAYALLPIYQSLDKLEDSENKMMLSYYMKEYGLEQINDFVNQLTDGQFSDVYEFVNNDNVEGLVVNIQSVEDSEDAE